MSPRRATMRAASAGLAVASVLLLATCDLDKLTTTPGTSGAAPFDSTELNLGGGTFVTLGGSATLTVTSSSVSLANVEKRYYSATPSIIAVDSGTGVMTGVALGTAKVTAKILAPELGDGVTISRNIRVRFKGIKLTSPIAQDSIQGLGQTRTATIFGLNDANVQVGASLPFDSLRSRDTTVVSALGTTIRARKNGTTRIVAFFDGLMDSVSVRVRQVAKSITFPTTDYTARHVNFNLTVPLTVKDVADSIIASPTLTWRTKDTTKATIGATTGILRMKQVATDSVWAKMDTVERGQKIIVSQVVASLSKFAGDAQTDTVALPIAIVPTVTALDSGSTPVVGASVLFRPGVGLNATVTDTLQVTDANGRAKPTAWKLGDTVGTNTLIATSGAATTTFTAAAVHGAPKRLVFVAQPTSTTTGVPFASNITVKIVDSLGNLITGSTANVTVALSNNPGAAVLAGTATVAAVNGVATFSNLSLNATGSGYTLQASSASLTPVISNAFDIFGAPTKVAFTTQPSGTTAGATMSTVRVAIQDASGTTVTTSTASVTIAFSANPSAATLGGTKTIAAVAGVATFTTLSVNLAGSGYSFQATSTGLTGAVSNTFTIAAVGAPAKLAFNVQPSNVVSGAAIAPSITVNVLDANGALVTSSSQQVTLSIDTTSPGGATLSGTLSRNAVAGVATFNDISLNKSGTGYKLLATASGGSLTPATSTGFNVATGVATKLGFVQQPTHTVAAQTMSPAVVVEVEDAAGNRVTTGTYNVILSLGTCSATLTGGGAQPSSAGVATFSGLSISTTVTGCRLTASASGLTSSPVSDAFNIVTASGAVKLKFTTQPSASTTAGVAIATAPVVSIQDASGNNVTTSSTSITLSIVSGPQTFFNGGGGSQSTTNSSTFSLIKFNTAGDYRLLASATGFKSDTSAIITVIPAAANRVGFVVPPSNSVAGVPFSPTVKTAVMDQFNNVVAGATNTISLSYFYSTGTGPSPTLNTGNSSASQVAVNSVATYTGLAPRTAGTMGMCTNSSGLNGSCAPAYLVVPAPLSTLGFSSQPPSFDTTGVPISPAVAVAGQDSVGNTITDFANAVTVAMTGGNPAATLSGTKTVAPAGGVATFSDLSIDMAGQAYQFSASASGVSTGLSNTFTVYPQFVSNCCISNNDHTIVGSTLYFVGGNALKSVPITGAATTGTNITGSTNAFKIATNGTDIFWAEQGSTNSGDAFIKKLTVSGGTISTLTIGLTTLTPDWPQKMYADGSNVYFMARNAAANGYAIMSVGVNASGATPTELFPNTGSFGQPNFLVAGGLIYFFDPQLSAIRRMTTTGASLTTLTTGTVTAQRFALSGTTLYFNDGVVIKSIANANTASSAVAPTTVFTAPSNVYDILADGTNLYFNFDGTLRRYSTSDFTTFTDLITTNPNVNQWYPPLVISGSYIYFHSSFGRFVRAPK